MLVPAAMLSRRSGRLWVIMMIAVRNAAISGQPSANTQRGRALITLREMVLKGEFRAGDRIEEIELSRRLGVSKPILKSAIERLVLEGLLELTSTGTYTARRFTVQDIRDAILARGSLEGLAARLAAKRAQDRTQMESSRRVNRGLSPAQGS